MGWDIGRLFVEKIVALVIGFVMAMLGWFFKYIR